MRPSLRLRLGFAMVVGVFWGLLLSSGTGFAAETLPDNLKWITNDTAPLFTDPSAKKGGTYRTYMLSFPLTLRTVGPDSNGSFRLYINGNRLSALEIHPTTEEILPSLATHWAYGDDKKTMYFKLNPKARWSDGHPVTAEDFEFGLEFMRSKNIVAPWYNTYYSQFFDRVIIYDDHTYAVVGSQPFPELHLRIGLAPRPKHFYKGEVPKDYVRRFNWKVEPNTGPYIIDKVDKGKSITFKRKKDWWGKDLRYNQGRYNVDRVRFTVIRDINVAYEHFRKNRVDDFTLTLPSYWHQKSKNLDIFDKGYAKKYWFYTNQQEPSIGFWINLDKEPFTDRNVVHAFAHSLNVDKLLNELLRGDYSRLHNQFTGYGEYTNPDVRARPFDIKKVGELMRASGWERGKDGIWAKGKQRFSFTITHGATDLHTQRLVLLQEEAKKAGVEFKLQRLDGSASFKLAQEKKHEVIFTAFGTGLRPQYWEFFHSSNAHKPQTNNFTNTDDPELDKIVYAYRHSIDVEERKRLSREIQAMAHEVGGFVPLYKVSYFRTITWRWWQFPKVPGTRTSDELFEPFALGNFWMDEDLKKETEAAMKSGKTFETQLIVDKTYKAD